MFVERITPHSRTYGRSHFRSSALLDLVAQVIGQWIVFAERIELVPELRVKQAWYLHNKTETGRRAGLVRIKSSPRDRP